VVLGGVGECGLGGAKRDGTTKHPHPKQKKNKQKKGVGGGPQSQPHLETTTPRGTKKRGSNGRKRKLQNSRGADGKLAAGDFRGETTADLAQKVSTLRNRSGTTSHEPGAK